LNQNPRKNNSRPGSGRFSDKNNSRPGYGKSSHGDRDKYSDKPGNRYSDKSGNKFGDKYGDKSNNRFSDKNRPARKPGPFRSVPPEEEAAPTPTWMRKVKNLHTEKGREKEGKFLAEGMHCVEEVMLHHEELITDIYYTASAKETPLGKKILASELNTHEITEDEMADMSTTVTSQGVFAVCRAQALRPDWDTAKFITLVDAVQDPGNLGAIFRSSIGFGMDAVVMGTGSVNPFNPKVVRGSSGTFLRMPFETRVDLAERIQYLRGKGYTILATSSHTHHTLENLPKIKKKVAFLVGNEGAGSRYTDLADAVIKIPMNSELESLNVAVAHGIMSYFLIKGRK